MILVQNAENPGHDFDLCVYNRTERDESPLRIE
jgi:hypothetical protein